MSVRFDPPTKKAPVADYRYYSEWLDSARYRELCPAILRKQRAAKVAALIHVRAYCDTPLTEGGRV
jgi:hypothetical protein